MSWSAITQICFSSEEYEPLLLLYDTTDKIVNHEDGDQISKFWKNATLIKCHGNKHHLMPCTK